jgi:hypothetical protein
MKKIIMFAAVIAASAFIAACGAGNQAYAGTLAAYNNAPGTVVYGIADAYAIDKDTNSGNRVVIKYSNGVQYAVDDANWSVYNRITSATTFASSFVRVGTTARYMNVTKSNSVVCQSSGSYIAFPVSASGPNLDESYNDGCQFWQAVKAVAN